MLNHGDAVTLNDNKKYTVVASTLLDSETYVYLIDQDDYSNNMFCRLTTKGGLQQILDATLIKKLMSEFQKEIFNFIN